jgi:hypothetical protein
MSVAISTTPLYSSGPISFSSLRTEFQQPVNPGQISASELRRITATDNTDPVVPDATENAQITTANDWKAQSFRYSIKRYDIIQSGTDVNTPSTPSANGINLENNVYWNNNLTKNIKKRAYVTGTCANISTGAYGASFNATAYNLKIHVDGFVYGQGGLGAPKTGGQIKGSNGGPALYVNSSGGSVEIIVGGSARIWAGGAGGSRGATGATGSSGQCTTYYNQDTAQGCPSPPACNAGSTKDNGTRQVSPSPCYTQFKGPTYYPYVRQCEYSQTFAVPGAPGGAGGKGGDGQGYSVTRTDAPFLGQTDGPDVGTNGGCPTYGGTGNNGDRGSNGGDWGTDSAATNLSAGGTAGRAITGSNYTTTGATSNIKGFY